MKYIIIAIISIAVWEVGKIAFHKIDNYFMYDFVPIKWENRTLSSKILNNIGFYGLYPLWFFFGWLGVYDENYYGK